MEYTSQLFGYTWLCWAFILLAIAILFMPSGKRKKNSALETLHQKFADGTLTLAEYEERKSVLGRDVESGKKRSSWF